MQKLARAVIGTNNVDNCSRYCQAPATTGLFRTVGYGGDSGSIADIEQADLVVIIGSNTAESHPVLATRVKRAHKLHGQKLIVSDLREHEMARRADLFLHPRPSTDLVWLSAVSRYLLDQGLAETEFLNQWVNGLDEYRKSLEPFTLEFASRNLRPPGRDARSRWRSMIAEAKRVCILWAMGVTQHSNGSDTSTAISNLLLVTGNYMRPGTGAYPLRGHNNVQGASDHGAMPNILPGYQSVDDPEVRARFESGWGVTLPTTKGLDNHEMVDAIHEGKLKAMYLFGEEMSIVDSNANYVARAFQQTRLLRGAGHLLQRDLPLRRRRAARQPEPRKGRHVHQHRAAHPAALSGVRAARRKPARLGRSSRTSRTGSAPAGTTSILRKSWMRSRR